MRALIRTWCIGICSIYVIQQYFDAGHGGHWAASFVNENLLNNLLAHEEFDTDLKTALSTNSRPTRNTGQTVSVSFKIMSIQLLILKINNGLYLSKRFGWGGCEFQSVVVWGRCSIPMFPDPAICAII